VVIPFILTRRRFAASCIFAVVLLCAAAAAVLPAQTLTFLFSFSYYDPVGFYPAGPLVQATDGNIYETVPQGADNYSGTIVKMSQTALSTLYSFCSGGGTCPDGSGPSGLIQATDGNLYGTTGGGGANGSGTVFKLTLDGTLTTLYSFCAGGPSCPDGSGPGGLMQASNGDFYGTTGSGGFDNPDYNCPHGCGTLFKITAAGALTTLYTFCTQDGCPDGFSPSGLAESDSGYLYGATVDGGGNYAWCGTGCGTVYKITPDGTLTTLYWFCSQDNCADGAHPFAAPQPTPDGNAYGTTSCSGPSLLCGDRYSGGTLFKISASGAFTLIHNFCAENGCRDGSEPSGVFAGSDGGYYGTTFYGGLEGGDGYGTIFKLTPDGLLRTVYRLPQEGGHNPSGLVQATTGEFYGTTLNGGVTNIGTIFSLSAGLGPFVETRPTFGQAGAAVEILGTGLTGATGVTFNGTAAGFTVVSDSLIAATVPAGATSGTVQVLTPGGALPGNVIFVVRQ
jgi:uncharacterized repeat protein (TIGR03803 family)